MKIKFISGEHSGEVMEFSAAEVSIGREDGNSIQLLTGGVSRFHAEIRRQDDGVWEIRDLGSTNGVKVDGVMIEKESALAIGNVITIGEQRLEIIELDASKKVVFQPVAQSEVGTKTELQIPEEEQKTAEQEAFNGEKLLEELKSVGSGLFGKRENNDVSSVPEKEVNDKKTSAEKSSRRPSKKLFNIVFYICLSICAISVIKMFVASPEVEKKAEPGISLKNCVIHFERIEYDSANKNAFRMEMTIENGKMLCVVDDIAGMRHFKSREISIEGNYEDEFEKLVRAIRDSGIFKMQNRNVVSQSSSRDSIRLVFCIGKDAGEFTYSQNSAPNEFNKCCFELRNFLHTFGLSTIAQNRNEIENEARSHLRNGLDKLDNYISDIALLREASRDFEAAVSCYEQFSPAPPELKTARENLAKVALLRKQLLKQFQDEFSRSSRRNDYPGMADACQNIMKIAGENSDAYREAASMLSRVRNSKNRRGR